jgi:ABC-2 type transport system permease protein
MRIFTFANRNRKELLRDPISLAFLLGFPIVLMLLLSAIQQNIPTSLFEIDHLAPGITVFGLSFVTLFSATIIAKDRTGSLLQRLYTTPMTAFDFIFGYTLPLLPIALLQCLVCYLVALPLGLTLTVNLVYAILFLIPVSLIYIALGLLFGSILNDKQVGGICGGLLTNLSAWLSGIWFDLDLVGGAFRQFAELLPFVHAVEMERAVVAGNLSGAFPHLLWVLGYALAVLMLAVFAFLRRMKRQ